MLTTTPISQRFANERIRATIQGVQDTRARMGLARLDGRLAKDGVPPGVRLHMIAAIRQLNADSARSRHERYLRAIEGNAEDDE